MTTPASILRCCPPAALATSPGLRATRRSSPCGLTAVAAGGTRPNTGTCGVSKADFRRRGCLDWRGAVHSLAYQGQSRIGPETI